MVKSITGEVGHGSSRSRVTSVTVPNVFDAASGFGGYRESVFGREGGREGLREYVNVAQSLPPGGIDGFLPRTALRIWLRNRSMRMMTSWPWRGLITQWCVGGASE